MAGKRVPQAEAQPKATSLTVFVSWSGHRAQRVAEALKRWIPSVIQSTRVWVSSKDIESGSYWTEELFEALRTAGFGVLVVTPESAQSQWVVFEAGQLAAHHGRAAPYFVGMGPTDIKGPLGALQGKTSDKGGTFELLNDINKRCLPPIDEAALENTFDWGWSTLEKMLVSISAEHPPTQPPPRGLPDKVDEVLTIVRELKRTQDEAAKAQLQDSLSYLNEIIAGTALPKPSLLTHSYLFKSNPLATGGLLGLPSHEGGFVPSPISPGAVKAGAMAAALRGDTSVKKPPTESEDAAKKKK